MRLLSRLRPLSCFTVLLDLPQLHVYPPAFQSESRPAAATHSLSSLGRYRGHRHSIHRWFVFTVCELFQLTQLLNLRFAIRVCL